MIEPSQYSDELWAGWPGFGSWLGQAILQEARGVTSQKTSFFIVTAVKTSNLSSLSEEPSHFSPEDKGSMLHQNIV
jgi:hypothetical protein